MPLKVLFDTWGGGPVSPSVAANTPATGSELAPVIRVLPRKSQIVLFSQPLPPGTQTSAWFDTIGNGDIFVTASIFATGGGNGIVTLAESDDPSNASQAVIINSGTYTLGAVFSVIGQIRKRYWRVQVSNVGALQTSTLVTVTTATGGITFISGQGQANTIANQIPVSITSSGTPSDAAQAMGVFQSNAVSQPLAVAQYGFVSVPTAGANVQGLRTPNFFKTSTAVNAGNTAVWTPAAGKKFRLMRYQIELTENATLAVAALVTVKFQDNVTDFGFQYDQWIPVTAVPGATVIGEAWRSGWIDLGNGYISTVANNVLNFNMGGGANLTAGQFRINVAGTEE